MSRYVNFEFGNCCYRNHHIPKRNPMRAEFFNNFFAQRYGYNVGGEINNYNFFETGCGNPYENSYGYREPRCEGSPLGGFFRGLLGAGLMAGLGIGIAALFKNAFKENPNFSPQGTPQGTPQGVPKGTPQGTPQGTTPQGTTPQGTTPQGTPQGTHKSTEKTSKKDPNVDKKQEKTDAQPKTESKSGKSVEKIHTLKKC